MKLGIISNTELCIPLLHDLKRNKIHFIFYLGCFPPGNSNILSLISFCKSNNIPFKEEQNKEELYPWLHKHQPDYSFIFGYQDLIDIEKTGEFKNKIFNIHPGKLPGYRGPNPVFWQLKRGEPTVGLTIHLLDSKFDCGPIVWTKEINNEPHFTHGLVDFLFSNLLIEGVYSIVSALATGEGVNHPVLQNESKYGYYSKPSLKDVLIDWKTMTAHEIINLVKACNPWNKGAITMYKGMELKIVDAELVDGNRPGTPGTVMDIADGIKVVCSDNKPIRINHLNINGIFVPARFADKFGFTEGSVFEGA